MRTLILAAAALLLAGCGALCWHDMHGLDPPPWNSSIPTPSHR